MAGGLARDPERRKWSGGLRSKGVSQPNGVVISNPTVQQRPSAKEAVHPFEIATAAATPKKEQKAGDSFMTRIEYIFGGSWAVGGEVKSRDAEARQTLNTAIS